MKSDIVNYELAILLKKKKFPFVCRAYYCYEKKNKKINLHHDYYSNAHDALTNKSFFCYAAPIKSNVQKWLRDKHNIAVEVSFNFCAEKNEDLDYRVAIITGIKDVETIKWFTVFPDNSDKFYPSYESALEAGILEALKEIK